MPNPQVTQDPEAGTFMIMIPSDKLPADAQVVAVSVLFRSGDDAGLFIAEQGEAYCLPRILVVAKVMRDWLTRMLLMHEGRIRSNVH